MGSHLFVAVMLVTSALVGTIATTVVFRRPLRPLDGLIKGLEEIQKGNYDVRIPEKGGHQFYNISKNFNTMAQELGSIETLRSDFISSFSHEFKTPIASIKGFAKLLKNPALTEEERREYLDIIITESERLSQLATNTLNIKKIESMEMIAEKSPYRLDEQIRQCVLILEPRWSEKKQNLSLELGEVVLNGNEELMHQVWINLIDNAVKFTPENGDIVIALKVVDNSGIFTISDNGIGMTAETQKHVFEKFYQGDKSRAIEGSGVGLSIVKKIVEISEGNIKVKSVSGEGTTFIVVLPLCNANDKKAADK
jgi:signal transduction histidine kinase